MLNALTTRTTTTTVLSVQASAAELFLLNTVVAPDQLRIELSPALVILREARAPKLDAALGSQAPDAPSVATELGKLASLMEGGLLTRNSMRSRRASLPGHSHAGAPALLVPLEHARW